MDRRGIGGQDIHLHDIPINQRTKDQWGITAPAVNRSLPSSLGSDYIYPGSTVGRRAIQHSNQPVWEHSGGMPVSYNPITGTRFSIA